MGNYGIFLLMGNAGTYIINRTIHPLGFRALGLRVSSRPLTYQKYLAWFREIALNPKP